MATTIDPKKIKQNKLNEEVKALSRKSGNKKCFDCYRDGPQNNVCLTFGTFVCTQCAGLLREFTFKVKSISMTSFTEEEVDILQTRGNKKVAKVYCATYNNEDEFAKKFQNNPDAVKNKMQMTYIKKNFMVPKSEGGEREKKSKSKPPSAVVKSHSNANQTTDQNFEKVPDILDLNDFFSLPMDDAAGCNIGAVKKLDMFGNPIEQPPRPEPVEAGNPFASDSDDDRELPSLQSRNLQQRVEAPYTTPVMDLGVPGPTQLGMVQMMKQSPSSTGYVAPIDLALQGQFSVGHLHQKFPNVQPLPAGASQQMNMSFDATLRNLNAIKEQFRLSKQDLQSILIEVLKAIPDELAPSSNASWAPAESNPFDEDKSILTTGSDARVNKAQISPSLEKNDRLFSEFKMF